MTIWDPFQELSDMRREMSRGYDGPRGSSPRTRFAFLPAHAARMYPLVNMHDDGTNLFVEAMVPGVEPEQMEVTIVGSTLTISGEKPGLGDVPPERIHRNERAAARFMRNVQLPAMVDRDRTTAQYGNGLLLLSLPRSEAAMPRKVAIQANGSQSNDGSQSKQQNTQEARNGS
jgi:HSP20 family protein